MANAAGPSRRTPEGSEVLGPLSRAVLHYQDLMKQLIPTVANPTDWGPLAELVAVNNFERVGSFLEVQSWQEYTEMLTQWASRVSRFETTVHRISELSNLVFFEIEERHFSGSSVAVVNSMTVFGFEAEGKICHLDVYLQQSR